MESDWRGSQCKSVTSGGGGQQVPPKHTRAHVPKTHFNLPHFVMPRTAPSARSEQRASRCKRASKSHGHSHPSQSRPSHRDMSMRRSSRPAAGTVVAVGLKATISWKGARRWIRGGPGLFASGLERRKSNAGRGRGGREDKMRMRMRNQKRHKQKKQDVTCQSRGSMEHEGEKGCGNGRKLPMIQKDLKGLGRKRVTD